MPILVGLDCGGSSTRTIAVDESGRVIFQGQGGSANLASTPEKVLTANLRRATEGCPPGDFVCGCFAGLLTSEDRERAESHLKRLFPSAKVKAEPDYAAAFFASEPRPDLCVISGTGSLICSAFQGRIVKTGGGGFMLGDFGSAYRFGRDALSFFLFGDEKPSERLRQAVIEHFGTDQPHAVIARVYKSPAPAALVGRLSKTVGQEAAENIPYAVYSVESNMAELARLARRHVASYVLKRDPYEPIGPLEMDSLSISLAGGVWKAGAVFRAAFSLALQKSMKINNLNIHLIQQPPVKGAVMLAKEWSHAN